MLTEKLKLLAGVSAILLLTSCSKVTSWFSSYEESKPDTYVDEMEQRPSEYVDMSLEEAKMLEHHERTIGEHSKKHHHKHHETHIVKKASPSVIVSNEQIPGKSCNCVDVMYNSQADKEQMLGVLQPGYVMPKPTHHYVPHEEHKKKVVRKKAKKKLVKKADVKNDNMISHSDHVPSETPSIQQPSAPVPVVPTVVAPVPALESQATPALPVITPEKKPEIVAPLAAPVVNTPNAVTPQPSVPAAPNANAVPAPQLPALNDAKPVAPQPVPSVPQPSAPTADAAQVAPQAPAQQPSGSVVFGRITDLTFADTELQLSATHTALLDKIIEDLKQNPAKSVKVQSYAFSASGNASEARRNSYQRAIAVRKYLIDRDIMASRITVNAFEDVNNKSNKIELTLEDIKQ